MKRKINASSKQAFTRLELAALLTGLALLAAIALPVLASSKLRSEQVTCLSNLRQVGHAAHLWANEHGDRTPWATPESEGGTRGSSSVFKPNPWFQIGWMSNELVTPKILVCPSDQVGGPRKMANDFSNRPGGFFNPAFRNSSLSYLVGLHAIFELSWTILGGDRNIRWDAANVGCSLGFLNAEQLSYRGRFGWTNSIHGVTGNLLRSDGSVEELSTAGLQRAVGGPAPDDDASDHFLAPP